jgi:chemotaxis protein methyltransferase CheR
MAFSFFFRDLQIIDLAVNYVIPDLVGRSRPSIWDAGCAMGQEPYTLAMVLADNMQPADFSNLRIIATDLDDTNTFGDIVRNAVYLRQDLERIPPGAFQKYFEPADDPDHFRVISKIRDRLTFQQHNLLSLRPVGNIFSLILCKNVLLHFQAEERVQVISMFHSCLCPGGILAFEQTQKMPDVLSGMFTQLNSHCQVFQRLEGCLACT